MAETLQLSLSRPVAITAAGGRIWIADNASASLAGFDPRSARLAVQIALAGRPVALAAGSEFVAAGLDNGLIAAYEPATGKELWRGAAGSANLRLKAAGERLWAWDREAATLAAFGVSGAVAARLDTPGIAAFAPVPGGVAWLTAGGSLCSYSLMGDADGAAELPSGSGPFGDLLACANALWLSAPGTLVLIDLRNLAWRVTLPAPEGPVSHLACADGRLFGGERSLFVLDPAADARARPLLADLLSPLLGLAATQERLWALERAGAVVHILSVA
jgi:hypothetical protein